MLRYTVFALILVAVTSVHCASRARRQDFAPGLGVSAGQQCRDRGYNAACRVADPAERCTQLKCTYTERGDIPVYETYEIGAAKDGTFCGDRKICVAGKCIYDVATTVVKSEEEYDCITDDYEEGEDYE